MLLLMIAVVEANIYTCENLGHFERFADMLNESNTISDRTTLLSNEVILHWYQYYTERGYVLMCRNGDKVEYVPPIYNYNIVLESDVTEKDLSNYCNNVGLAKGLSISCYENIMLMKYNLTEIIKATDHITIDYIIQTK